MQSRIQILEVRSNLFQFKFQSEFDLNRILKGGLWSFDNQLLTLTKWRKGMTASNVKLGCASLWIQIWGAPFDMVFPQVAIEVGSCGGCGETQKVRCSKLFHESLSGSAYFKTSETWWICCRFGWG